MVFSLVSLAQHKQEASYNITSEYLTAATSENTRLAYQTDRLDFLKRGGQLPATPEMVVQYLEACAVIHNPRTLVRRVNMLS